MDDQRRSQSLVRGVGGVGGGPRHARARITRHVAIAVLGLAGLACDNVNARLGPGISIGSGTNTSTQHSALVGLWTRVVVLTDNQGNEHSSRTTWEFRSDGSATRTVVTHNLSAGITDVLTSNATWHTEGSTIVITFRPPDSGTSRFSFTVFGNVLTLDGRDFVRIG